MKELKQRYSEILLSHIESPLEEHLFKAGTLGKEYSKKGVVLPEMIKTHFDILNEREDVLNSDNILKSQEVLLEVAMAMSIEGNAGTLETVMPVLYDELILQFNKLRDSQVRLRENELELKKRIKELEDFYDLAVHRELKMIELKKEIERLNEELEGYKNP